MHKRLEILALISLTLVACVVAAPRPMPTPTLTSTVAVTATPTAAATPTPTISPTPTAGPGRAVATPFWAWSDLAPYRAAMRPGWVGDVDRYADATRYEIEITVDIEARTFRGTELVRYTNHEHEALAEIVFRLLPNTPGYGGALDVSTITANGVEASTYRGFAESALYVPLAAPLAPQESAALELAFVGTLPTDSSAGYAQYGYIDGVLALPNFYPLIPVYDDEGWNVELAPAYGDATFSDTSLYAARVTLPEDMILAASGVVVGREDNGDGTVTYAIASGPMRDLNLVASADYRTAATTVDEVLVTSYYLPGDAAGGQRALDYAARSLAIYEELIGPYPFNELDVVSTPTQAGGIEYPGLIVVAESLYGEESGFFELATVHEVAHQWWYSLVGNDQLDEPWLDEALTQYTSLLYFELRYGKQAAESLLENSFRAEYENLKRNDQDMPVGLPVEAYPEHLYGPVVYGKGPLFFHEMRLLVGDDAYFRILRAYASQYRYGIAYPLDLVALAEQISGQDLDPLYDHWILGLDD